MDRDRTIRLMRRHASARRQRDERQAQRTLFHESPRAPAVARHQILVDHLLVALEMMDQDVTFDRTVQ
jgi:hypothetical protein